MMPHSNDFQLEYGRRQLARFPALTPPRCDLLNRVFQQSAEKGTSLVNSQALQTLPNTSSYRRSPTAIQPMFQGYVYQPSPKKWHDSPFSSFPLQMLLIQLRQIFPSLVCQ